MSAASAVAETELSMAQPLSQGQAANEPLPKRPLEIAPPFKKYRPKIIYALVSLTAVSGVIAAQLMFSVALTQGAYEIDGYQAREAALSRQKQSLTEDLDRLESPQFLAKNAESLGMVPNAHPAYIRLSDGAVLGTPKAAVAGGLAAEGLVSNALIDGITGTGVGAAGTGPGVGGLPTPETH